MGRFMIFLGIILIIFASGVLIYITTGIEGGRLSSVFEDMYCTEKESFKQFLGAYQYSSSSSGGGRPVNWYCELEDGTQREITGKVAATIVGAFLVPFLLGLFLTMIGSGIAMKNGAKRIMQNFGIDNLQGSQNMRVQSNVIDLRQGSSGYENLPPESKQMIDSLRQGLTGQSGFTSGQQTASSGSLTDKLRELESAYNQGLISKDEYDRTRTAILDKIDD
jgi:hypothetical protein